MAVATLLSAPKRHSERSTAQRGRRDQGRNAGSCLQSAIIIVSDASTEKLRCTITTAEEGAASEQDHDHASRPEERNRGR